MAESAEPIRQNLESIDRRIAARARSRRQRDMTRLRMPVHSGQLDSQDGEPHSYDVRPRSGLNSGDRPLQRHRVQQQQEGNALTDSIDTVQQAVERLNQASSNLSSLLDEPIPRVFPSNAHERDILGAIDGDRRRAKRRKLDAETNERHFRGFRYGYHGQVASGPLKMEIVSCDGGNFDDQHARHYWPENVLRNDKSVYCTESDKCNIILRHRGETPFCLKKLVIKAPERGFTAPYAYLLPLESEELLTWNC